MANWREVKRRALGPVHSTFAIPAVYITHAAGIPVPVNVRHHDRTVQVAPEGGDWSSAAQISEADDVLVFMLSELSSLKVHSKSYVLFSDTEAYFTGPSLPARAGFAAVSCSKVSQGDLAKLLADTDLTHDAWKTIAPWSQL